MNSKSRSVSFGIATFFAVTASFAYLATASTAQGHAATPAATKAGAVAATPAATKAGAVAATAAATAAAHTAPHWTYEGAEGPDEWGTLDNSFATCSTGHAQSPINLTKAQKIDLTDIKFNYKPSTLNIFNNGHTIQVAYDAGSTIVYNEIEYKLLQFHFHHPSEHTIDGKAFDMELHLVHQAANGDLAVVGVMIQQSDKDNPAFASMFDKLPATAGTPQPTSQTIDVNKLLPDSRLYDTYVGSLTTPPCSEGVRWLVLTTPVSLSAKQIDEFAHLFELNARPVQPINNRDLLQDSTTK
jgi:carbonic anhydrase